MAHQILEGIKVADFTWAGVGPQVCRELAEHGATVIRVESHRRLDILRASFPYKDGKPGVNRSAFFAEYNANKHSISLDLNTDKGQEVARRLVRWADIVGDSMTPGTMSKWGLDYERCQELNPEIIYFSTTQQGQYGPHSKFQGVGLHVNALAGFCDSTGWADSEPTNVITAYSDFISPWYLTVAIIGALLRRRETGKGLYMEQSQLEAGATFLASHVLDFTVNNRVASRRGNRDRYMCPHGVYPCKGSDRWVAIAIQNDAQWSQLCNAMGQPEAANDPRFATFATRKEHEDELDEFVAEWTVSFDPQQIMSLIQNSGIPAGVIQTGEDLLNDPQLKHRNHFKRLHHPEIGVHHYHSPAYRLSKTPCRIERPAPCLGEHNEYVFKEILGYSDDEMADMLVEGIITTEADAPTLKTGA